MQFEALPEQVVHVLLHVSHRPVALLAQVPPGHVARQLVPLRNVPVVQDVQLDALPLQVPHGAAQLSQVPVALLANRPAGHVVTQLELFR